MRKTLVDSSVWISHFRKADRTLIRLLENDLVLTHPFVLQELYLGRPKGKEFIFNLLGKLVALPTLTTSEIFVFIEKHRLVGQGIGIVDTHLLGAAFFAEAEIYTHDQKLKKKGLQLLK